MQAEVREVRHTTLLCSRCHRDADTLERWCMVWHKWVEKCPKEIEDNDNEDNESEVEDNEGI